MADQHSRRDFLRVAGAMAGGAVATGAVAAGAVVAGGRTPNAWAADTAPLAPPATPWDLVPVILGRINPPTFPAVDFPITRYGGSTSGDNTEAFRRAVTACHAAGGGRVVVPPGVYSTGAIHLDDNVNLVVQAGATIRFTTNRSRYPNVFTRWQGIECINYSGFIYARGKTNIAVTGRGTLDGQGESWRPLGGGGASWTRLQQQGANGTPVPQRVYGTAGSLRPNMIQFVECTRILIEGVTILRPAMWTVHPVLSRNITVRGITINSRGGGGNNDGVDPECCSDVHITGCTFNTGDDCIAIKSGRNNDGRRVGRASANIVIEDCTFVFSNRGAICVGSECSGGANNIFARNCRINPANAADQFWYALFLKTNNKRGGVMDNIHLQNITGNKFMQSPIFITMQYTPGGPGDTVNPVIRNITMDRLTMRGSRQAAVEIRGLGNARVSDVLVANSTFTGIASGGNRISNATRVTFPNTTINGDPV